MAGPLSSVGAAADENAAPGPAVKLAAGFEAFTYRGPDQPPAAKRPRSSEAADDDPSPAPARPAAARRALVSDDEDDPAPGPAAAAAAAIVLTDDDDDDGAAAEAEPDPLDACEAIASSLRAALGAPVAGDRFAGTATATAATGALALADDVAAAAGHAPSTRLKPYQVVGVNFLLLHAAKSGAAVVADDMGLGKTAQCCAALALRAARGTPGAPSNTGLPALVVVPSSLVDNWARELATWAPRLRVCRFWGAHRAALKATRPRAGDAPPFDVLLASYPTFERAGGDAKSDRSTIRKWAYGTVVLDEAHAIKNGASARAAKLRAAAAGARFRVFLTGTPLQNNLAELESLLSFLLPDVFARGGGLLTADDEGDDEATAVARARRALAPFILRRLKSEVADQLPEKKRVEVRLDLPPAQRDAYTAAVARLRADAAAAGAAATPDGLVAALGAAAAASSFTLLRKLAAHPLLVRTRVSDASLADLAAAATAAGLYGDAATRAMVDAEVATLSDLAIHKLALDGGRRFEGWRLPAGAARGSAKAAWLADNLPRLIADGHRVLLFSGWTSVLDILELLLADLGLPFSRLDGNTPVADRLALVDAFNAGGPDAPPVMLLSTRAGGQGLNLVGADTVVLHDSDFNPQVDAQAEDRAHRLGQTRPVTIYRLVADGTVDAGIVALAARKAALGAAVLGEGGEGEGEGGASGGETEKTAVARLLADALSA